MNKHYDEIRTTPIALGQDKVYIGEDWVDCCNNRNTYKEYLADRFAPLYKNAKGQKVKMTIPIKILVSALETTTKKGFGYDAHDRQSLDSFRTALGFKKFNPTKQRDVSTYYWVDGGDSEIGVSGYEHNRLKKNARLEYPEDFAFPKHLGRNNDLYKDLKEYHPDESRREKRLRIRSYAKKRREENYIHFTKEYPYMAGIISLPRRFIEFVLYVIKSKSVTDLVFKLLLFPFFLVNHISATQKLPTLIEIKESERYYYLAFRGLVRTVVYIALIAAYPIYIIISA